jgi:hypothetical protein
MKKALVVAAIVTAASLFVIGCQNNAQCLKKYGFTSCEELVKAYNTMDTDDALKVHAIRKECGCPDLAK